MPRKTREEKYKDLIMNTYRELYNNCITPVSFDFLVENSTLYDQGRKIIPYNDYFIDGELYDEIIKRNMKRMRLSDREKEAFLFEMHLGCGPVYLTKEEYDKKIIEQCS